MLPTQNRREDEAFSPIRRELERAVSAVCPYLGAAEKDDLVQAACLRLVKIQQKSEGNREFNSSYLRRVAYCALIDEARRVRRRREEPLEREMPDPVSQRSGNPEKEAFGRQVGSAIEDCLLVISRNRRVAVTLYLQGHGVPEAATLLGWSRKKVENLVYRGLADLRSCLSAKGIEP